MNYYYFAFFIPSKERKCFTSITIPEKQIYMTYSTALSNFSKV